MGKYPANVVIWQNVHLFALLYTHFDQLEMDLSDFLQDCGRRNQSMDKYTKSLSFETLL